MANDELPGTSTSPSYRTAAICLLLVSLLVRCLGLHAQSLTVDECHERMTAEMPFWELVQTPNSFPPLYHVLAKIWLVIDPHELSLRHFSLLTGLISIFAIRKLVAEAVDEWTGWVAGFMAAVSPFHIYYSQQGRCYMLYVLLGTLAMLYGARILRGATFSDALKFVLVGAAGGYTHYYMCLLLVAIGLGILLVRGWLFFARHVIPPAIAIGLLSIPLFALVRGDLDYQVGIRAPRPANVASLGYTFFSFESGYSLGPSRPKLHFEEEKRNAVRSISGWVVVALPVVLSLLVYGAFQLAKYGELRFWLSLIVVPFAVVALICSAFAVTYNTRFMVCCWVTYLVFTSTAIAAMPWRVRLIPVTLLGALYGAAVYNRNFVPTYQNEDARATAAFLAEHEKRVAYVCSGYMKLPIQKYAEDVDQIQGLWDRSYATGSEEKALEAVTADSFWFVYTREFHGDPEGAILQELKVNRQLRHVKSVAGMEIFEGGTR